MSAEAIGFSPGTLPRTQEVASPRRAEIVQGPSLIEKMRSRLQAGVAAVSTAATTYIEQRKATYEEKGVLAAAAQVAGDVAHLAVNTATNAVMAGIMDNLRW